MEWPSALRKIDRAEIAGTTADAAGDAFDDWTMKHALFRAVDEDGASVSRIADVVAAMQVLCGGGGGGGAAAAAPVLSSEVSGVIYPPARALEQEPHGPGAVPGV
jgi:hypothetical protein